MRHDEGLNENSKASFIKATFYLSNLMKVDIAYSGNGRNVWHILSVANYATHLFNNLHWLPKVFPVSYIEPCFLLSSPRFVSPLVLLYTLHSFHNNYLYLAHLVNSCELHNYYLVLSFLLMYSSSGLSTDVFFLIKRI